MDSHSAASFIFISHQLRIPSGELEWSFARSSGPGGQNVNKVNSKAILRWSVATSPSLSDELRDRFRRAFEHRLTKSGELILVSQRFRDQPRNAADCIEKLRAMLVAAMRPPRPRKPTKPSRGSVTRRLTAKRFRSEKKQSRGGRGFGE